MNTSSFTFTQKSTHSGISFTPSYSVNTGSDPKKYTETGLLEFSTPWTVAILLANDQEAKIEKINYPQLATEHAELISQGKTSVEIAQWIGDKLNIPSWKNGEFLWERKVLTSPQTPEETQRLQKFVEALGVSWTKANQPSRNHREYLLLDGYVQNALFGQSNMKQVDARLDTFHTDWQKMWNDSTAKAKYLFKKIGLDIKNNWSILTGIRDVDGDFGRSDSLYASGSLDGFDVRFMWLNQLYSGISLIHASDARLCFLA